MCGTVSIIIPIYNVKKYIEKCMKSVTRQTYPDLQIILVDDGSTDGSASLCDTLACQDSRIEVIHKINGGLSSARNAGLEAARGKYIYFLDADDYIDSELVETCVNLIEQKGCDIVVFNHIYENEQGEVIGNTHFKPYTYKLKNKNKKLYFLMNTQIEYDNCGWEAWSRFYNADLLQKNQLYFPDNREIFAEDLAHAMRACLYADKICVMKENLYHYVARGDSIMGALRKNPLDKFVKLCQDFEIYANEHNFGKEVLAVKDAAFSKIIYNELKKECKNYDEMAETIMQMDKDAVDKIRMWFKGFGRFRIFQMFCTHFRARTLLMYCEVYLINCILQGKRTIAIPEYWLWVLLCCIKKGRRFLCGICGKWNIYLLLIYKRTKNYIVREGPETGCPRAFLLGTEDFGNLGDHHIAVSELEFLRQYFEEVIEVSASRYFNIRSQRMLIKEISSRDVIFLTGGGNFGNVYEMARKIRNDVAVKWDKNTKVIMPQTAYYTSDKAGERALRKDKRLLSKEKNLTIVAREQNSYSFLKENFSCNILLAPDIVLHSSYNLQKGERDGTALLCLRSDIESILDESKKKNMKMLLRTFFPVVEHIDTQKPYDISIGQREASLKELIAKLQSVSLVVTDRLHGMIFCAVTGTPCLVFESYNHKIYGSYAWLKSLPYIKLIKDLEEMRNILKTQFWKTRFSYDVSILASQFEIIMESIGIEKTNGRLGGIKNG